MTDPIIEKPKFDLKFYMNGFPKSGLHFATLMMQPIVRPLPADGFWDKPWAGTFRHNSWSDEWAPLEQILFKVGRIQAGYYLKAHCGYREEIERFTYYSGIAHVFIYRDLRDVVVSQAHHIQHEDDKRFAHPDKEMYRKLGGISEIITACITGLDRYPGVMQRWELYAPWLDVPWVHKVRFEDMRADAEKAAAGLLRYGLNRVAQIFGHKVIVDDGVFAVVTGLMAESAGQTERSATFRKGAVGGWREHFTEEHKRLFKERDTGGWLESLGYAEGEDW